MLAQPFRQRHHVTIGGQLELLGEDRTLDERVETIVGEYEVDEPTARRDVETFVARLREARLLA